MADTPKAKTFAEVVIELEFANLRVKELEKDVLLIHNELVLSNKLMDEAAVTIANLNDQLTAAREELSKLTPADMA